jgi:hypothetical protein
MIELLRTNDLVLISAIEAILAAQNIAVFVADQFASAVEGSLGFLPRRVLVGDADAAQARRLIRAAGLAQELSDG